MSIFFAYFMNEIQISVVMSVFNEQDSLTQTIKSILDQEDVNFELIIVNDGSTDNTSIILDSYAEKDKRIKLIKQTNQGITNGLITGCRQAKGEFIARQDAGDWSLPGRLREQLKILRSCPKVVLCSTGSRYFSERGELLFEANLTTEEAEKGLTANSLASIKGPSHHGCTMFRRSAYEKCGGYRRNFFVAQDLDLWVRLAELGKHIALSEIYYEAVLRKNSISSNHRKSQEIVRRHIYECSQLRRKNIDDTNHTNQLKDKIGDLASDKIDPAFEYNYFVGSILLSPNPKRSRYYLTLTLKAQPWHIKAWGKLIMSYL